MSQAAEHIIYSTRTRVATASPGGHHPAKARDLSDREAVIAIMVANGAACEDISDRLSLPVRTVESYLRQALQLLELTDAENLTYVAVAAHYDRNPSAATTHP